MVLPVSPVGQYIKTGELPVARERVTPPPTCPLSSYALAMPRLELVQCFAYRPTPALRHVRYRYRVWPYQVRASGSMRGSSEGDPRYLPMLSAYAICLSACYAMPGTDAPCSGSGETGSDPRECGRSQ
eukprot:623414-Rhodomonas_salina.2